MAYNKEYPVLNSEKKEDSIEQWTRRQEDRIEKEFSTLSQKMIDDYVQKWAFDALNDKIEFLGGRVSNFDTISKNVFVGIWGPSTKYNPPEDYGILVQFRTWFDAESQPYIAQIGFGSSGNLYFRRYWGGSAWSGWNKVDKTSV